MHTDTWGCVRPPSGLSISRNTLASMIVAAALLTSTIVFSEPAVADALMGGVIVGVPLLGAGRYGTATLFGGVVWLVVVGLGLAATMASATPASAVTHQLVTLYLLTGAVVLAGYIAIEPVNRFNLVMWCDVGACAFATVAALVGFFALVPGMQELFTNYGRARGTFKDPNVYGAALVPAMAFLAAVIIRGASKRAAVAAGLFVLFVAGLLLSFSRGAWIAAAMALLISVSVTIANSRRASDKRRLAIISITGLFALMAAIAALLQNDKVHNLLTARASMDQSYDSGPEGRFGGQQKARRLIVENPFGIGTHTFRERHHHEEPHNVFLSMFLNAGWLGGLLYLLVVVATAAIGLAGAFEKGPLQIPRLVAASAFTAMGFEGLVIDSDHWRHFFLLMALVWGLADAGSPPKNYWRRATDPILAAFGLKRRM